MMRLSVVGLVLSFLVVSVATAQNFFQTNYSGDKSYLLLMHPTERNIRTVNYLVEKGIFKVDSDIEFVGVYSEKDEYDYDQTIQLIQSENLTRFHLQEVFGDVSIEDVYKHNEWTDDYEGLFNRSIGAVFFGGPDMPPALYGHENKYSLVYNPGRHLFEVSFLFHLLGGEQDENYTPLLDQREEYLVTGICLGLQMMNVATGGSLIQDIPAELYSKYSDEETTELGMNNMHRNSWQKISDDSLLMGYSFHPIKFSDDLFFPKNLDVPTDMMPVILSSHHQAVEELGEGWIVTAWSPDSKVVEGIRHKEYPSVFAVQFHPEVPGLYEDLKAFKFEPSGEAKTYHQWSGKEGVKFQRKYWNYISQTIKELAKRNQAHKISGQKKNNDR